MRAARLAALGVSDRGTTSRVLLCDYAGVLTTSLLGAGEDVCRRYGVDHDGFRSALRALRSVDDPIARVERGEIESEDFQLQFTAQLDEALGGVVAGCEFLEQVVKLVAPEPRMIDAVHTLRKAGVRTALVSNSWSDHYPDEVLAPFDLALISGRLGMRKPEPEIYLHALRELGAQPAECCFVDDFEANVATADRLGMRTILHTTVELTLPQLSEFFGVELD